MENGIKKTKAMYYTELREMVMATVTDQTKQDELVEFIDKRIADLELRKVAAARRAEKRRAESDTLTDVILAQIGDELMTVDEIVLAVDDENITRNKVTARLGRLVKAGIVTKEYVKVDKHKRMAYKLATDEVETTDVVDENEETENEE